MLTDLVPALEENAGVPEDGSLSTAREVQMHRID